MENLTIENVKILYGEDLTPIDRGYLMIRDGFIHEVGRGKPPGKGFRIDGKGLTILPGLVNAHVHLGDSAAKELALGLSLEEAVAPPEGFKHRFLREAERRFLVDSMRKTASDMLASGVVCFADFREGGIEGLNLALKALEGLKIEALLLGRPAYHLKGDAFRREVEELALKASGLGVGSLSSYSDRELELMAEIFRDKPIGVHVAEAPGLKSSEVERALNHLKPSFMVHLVHAAEWELKLAAEAGVGVAVCPRSNASFGLGLPDLRSMLNSGLKVALGTDNVMVCQPDMFREMEFASRSWRLFYRDPAFPPPFLIFKMATQWAAEVLGLRRLGVVKEGWKASLILVDLEAANVAPVHNLMAAIVHRVRAENVMLTLVGGEIAFSRLPLGEWKA